MNLGIDQSLAGTNVIYSGTVYSPTGGTGWQQVISCPAAAPSSNIVTSILDTGATMVCYYDTGNNVTVLTDYEGQWKVLPIGIPLHAPAVGLSNTEANYLTGFAIQSEAYIYYLDVLGRVIQLSGSLFWQAQEISSYSGAPQGYPGAGIASAAVGVLISVFYTDMQGNIILMTPQGSGQWLHENISGAASAPQAALGFGMAAVAVEDQIHLFYMDQGMNLIELRSLGGLWTYATLGKQLNAPGAAYSNIAAFLLNGNDLRVYYVDAAREVIEFAGAGAGTGPSFNSTWTWSNVSQQISGCPQVTGQLYAGPGPNSLPQLYYRTNDNPQYPCGQVATLYYDRYPSIPPNPVNPLQWFGNTICHVVG